MRVLLLGVGKMGEIAALDLLESREVSKLIAADLSPERLRLLEQRAVSGKLEVIEADARDSQSLIPLVREVDVVANATWFTQNLAVQSAACEAKRHYVDLGGLYHMTLRQLERDGDARRAGITCLIGCGASPGVTNVVAAYGASQLDEVEEVKISEARVDRHPGINFTHSPRSIIYGWTTPAMVYEDGEYREVPPLTAKERIAYPEPVGEVDSYLYLHSELATLPRFLGKDVRRVAFFNSSPEMTALRPLMELGLIHPKTGNEPVQVGGVAVTPHEFLQAYFAKLSPPARKAEEWWAFKVQLRGRRNGEAAEYVYHSVTSSYLKWEARVVAYVTGVALSVGAQMLGRGEAKGSGVLPPEACLDPAAFLRAMGLRGVRVQEAMVSPRAATRWIN